MNAATTDLLSPGGTVAGPDGSTGTPDGLAHTKIRSGRSLFWERFREDKAAVVALFVIFLLILIAIDGGGVASWITGHQNATSYQRDAARLLRRPEGARTRSSCSASTARVATCSSAR